MHFRRTHENETMHHKHTKKKMGLNFCNKLNFVYVAWFCNQNRLLGEKVATTTTKRKSIFAELYHFCYFLFQFKTFFSPRFILSILNHSQKYVKFSRNRARERKVFPSTKYMISTFSGFFTLISIRKRFGLRIHSIIRVYMCVSVWLFTLPFSIILLNSASHFSIVPWIFIITMNAGIYEFCILPIYYCHFIFMITICLFLFSFIKLFKHHLNIKSLNEKQQEQKDGNWQWCEKCFNNFFFLFKRNVLLTQNRENKDAR